MNALPGVYNGGQPTQPPIANVNAPRLPAPSPAIAQVIAAVASASPTRSPDFAAMPSVPQMVMQVADVSHAELVAREQSARALSSAITLFLRYSVACACAVVVIVLAVMMWQCLFARKRRTASDDQ